MAHTHMRRHAETAKQASTRIALAPKEDARGVLREHTPRRVQCDARTVRLGTCLCPTLPDAQFVKQVDMRQRRHLRLVQHALQVPSVLREPMHA